jgi:hypothetical protein
MMILSKKFEFIFFILLSVFIITFTLYLGDWNISTFCNFGQQTISEKFPLRIIIFDGSIGYDGQYYCRMAIEPFNLSRESLGVNLDPISYRYSRILYPLLAWFLSFNLPFLSILNLFLINLISIYLIYLIGKKYLKFDHFIFFIPFLPFVVLRNTAELLCILFITLSIFALSNKKIIFFSIFSIFAILTRETSLIFYLIAGSFFFLKNKINFYQLVFLLLPAFVFFIWRVILFYLFKDYPEIVGIKVNFNFQELSFLKNYFLILSKITQPKYFIHSLQLSLIIWFMINVILRINFRKLEYIGLSFIAYIFIFNFLASHIYISDFAFFRVLPEIFILGFIIAYRDNTLNYKFKLPLIILFVLNIFRIAHNHYIYLY